MPRFVVLEPGNGEGVADHDLTRIASELAAGAPVIHGWHGRRDPASAPPVCIGRVESMAEAAQAVLAAVDGACLVVAVSDDRDLVDRLCDDLRRLGEVDHRVGPPVPGQPDPLSDDERALLSQLLGGATLGEAARHLHVSRRTADRRLASARRALGVGSTVEALRAAARMGLAG